MGCGRYESVAGWAAWSCGVEGRGVDCGESGLVGQVVSVES